MGEWVGIQEASRALGVSIDTVRRRIRRKELEAEKINGVWKVHMQDNNLPMQEPNVCIGNVDSLHKQDDVSAYAELEGCIGSDSDLHRQQDSSAYADLKPNVVSDTPNATSQDTYGMSGTLAAGMAVNQAIQQAVTQAMAPLVSEITATREDMRRLTDQLITFQAENSDLRVELAKANQRAETAERERELLAVEVVEWKRQVAVAQERQRKPWWKMLLNM